MIDGNEIQFDKVKSINGANGEFNHAMLLTLQVGANLSIAADVFNSAIKDNSLIKNISDASQLTVSNVFYVERLGTGPIYRIYFKHADNDESTNVMSRFLQVSVDGYGNINEAIFFSQLFRGYLAVDDNFVLRKSPLLGSDTYVLGHMQLELANVPTIEINNYFTGTENGIEFAWFDERAIPFGWESSSEQTIAFDEHRDLPLYSKCYARHTGSTIEFLTLDILELNSHSFEFIQEGVMIDYLVGIQIPVQLIKHLK